MTPRELGLSFQIDTNRINSRSNLSAMNRLEEWRRRGLIEMLISDPATREVTKGGNAMRTAKAFSYIISLDTFDTERGSLERRIEGILFPERARTASEQRDVQIVAHAKHYHCILITADGDSKRQPGGILGHRGELFQQVGVSVMTDEEAAALVASKIQRRDEAARLLAAVTGEELPSWMGSD